MVSMERNEVKRAPYISVKEFNGLPDEARNALKFLKNKVPSDLYKEMSREFVDINRISTKREKPVLTQKISTGTGDRFSYFGNLSQSLRDIGVYNPDKIPVNVYLKMSKDPTIALALSAIDGTIMSMNYRFQNGDETQREFVKTVLKAFYKKITKNLLKGVRIGFSCGEKLWDFGRIKVYVRDPNNVKKNKKLFDDDCYFYKGFNFLHPGIIRIRMDKKGNMVGISVNDPATGEIKKVNLDKLVFYTHDMEFENPFGNARLKNVYPAWYWGIVTTQFMLQYYERQGRPLTRVKAPTGTYTDNKGNQVNAIEYGLKLGQAAQSDAVVAIPSEFYKESNNPKWDLGYIESQQRGEMWLQVLNYFNSQKLRGVFVPDKVGLASDGANHATGGGGATGDSVDLFLMSEESLISDIEDVFNSQIIPDLLAYNFKEEEISDVEIKIDKPNYQRKILLKDVLLRMIMLSAGGIRDGKQPKYLPSMDEICESLEIPIQEFEDMFKTIAVPGAAVPGVPGTDNVQNNPSPTVAKKVVQDKNRANKTTGRKDRSSRDRSAREKRK